MTAEQEQECRDHLDAILEITCGIKLSTLLDQVREQMKLPPELEGLVIDIVQKDVTASMQASFAQTGEELKKLLNNPDAQAAMWEKLNAVQ
jgi:hypothetical protein